MKTIKTFILLCLITLLPTCVLAASFGDIRLSHIDGDVQINSESTRDWVPASFNVPLYEGDRIWVPDYGKAELHFRNGTAIRLNERTSSDILNYDRDLIQLYVNLGSIYVNYRDTSKNDVLQINTPVATIRAYNRAIFRVDVRNNGYTYISVYRGNVYTDYRDGRNVVEEGTTLLVRGYSREEAIPLGSPDMWTQWNFDRDRILYNDYRSTRYLPDELRYYSYDFDRHGKWVYVRDYGYCWTPSIRVSVGWAPYRHGKWTWMRGDYVWISYEPWGWVPYHYGRWAFNVSIGWFWVPPPRGSVYWGPGYVGWVHTPNYVSWVPLAPGETYYGYGNYGPHSVNLFNININKVVIKEKYKNATLRDGFTVVHRDAFISGKQEKIKVRENPFLRENISVGRPDMLPEKRTSMPIVRDVPREKLPPKEVKDTDIRTLKEKIPIQRQRDPQMQERMIAPRGKSDERQQITPLNGNRERERQIRPLEQKPEIQDKRTPGDGFRERTPAEIRDIKPDTNRQIAPQQERMKDRAPADIKRDSMQPPQIQDTKPDIRKERTREIMPQDVKPDTNRQITPQQERMKDRTPADIKRDSMQPPQIQDTKPDIRKERTREIMPQDVKPDTKRQIAPQQDKKGRDIEKPNKQSEKDSQGERKQNVEDSVIKERGFGPDRIR